MCPESPRHAWAWEGRPLDPSAANSRAEGGARGLRDRLHRQDWVPTGPGIVGSGIGVPFEPHTRNYIACSSHNLRTTARLQHSMLWCSTNLTSLFVVTWLQEVLTRGRRDLPMCP